jgi:hypothetical protein
MMYLVVFFGVLSVVLGIWGFGPWMGGYWSAPAVLALVCVGIFLLLLTVLATARQQAPPRPMR